jgi:calcium-dependent protein kinase
VLYNDLLDRSGVAQNVIIANQDKDIRDFYDIDHQPVLGSGISGQVKICVHKATKLQYALKSLSKRALPREKLARMKDEIRCMAHLDHPNILRIHEFFENKDVIYLILELCRGGELLDRLHQQQGHHYSEKVACRYVHTMMTAIAYCHANNVVHRDLKLENFLFESDKPDSELKLIGTVLF